MQNERNQNHETIKIYVQVITSYQEISIHKNTFRFLIKRVVNPDVNRNGIKIFDKFSLLNILTFVLSSVIQ